GGTDLGAERPRDHVLPRTDRAGWAETLFDRPDRPQRTGYSDAAIWLGPGLVSPPRLRCLPASPRRPSCGRCGGRGESAAFSPENAAFWPYFVLRCPQSLAIRLLIPWSRRGR